MTYKFVFLLSFFTLMNCATKNKANKEKADGSGISAVTSTVKWQTDENVNKTVELAEGETKFLADQKINIRFKNVVQDSRCPEGVNCIWAGAATVNIEVMSTTSRPMTLQLSTIYFPTKSYHKTENFNGLSFTLVKVSPYPSQTENAAKLKGKYKIQLQISTAKEENSELTKPLTTE